MTAPTQVPLCNIRRVIAGARFVCVHRRDHAAGRHVWMRMVRR